MERGSRSKQFVYSIKITKEESQLLKKNKNLKKELNEIVRQYLKAYLKDS
ncbi:hypothetical protein NNC19_23055 [Clostridium sp. SHJSY1]|nr:hypothetical protein [Clostridium sp. SHJSY1]MDS0528556.1 hypothetical protein [Clostridium sp. SHJSY1]